MTALHELSVAELGAAIRCGEATCIEVASAALDRISALDPRVNAFTLVTAERAMADAERADTELRLGHDRGPLHGIPYGLKDIIATAGIRTSCNSALMLDNVPDADAEVAARLRVAGGVLLGKLNTAEFALGGGEDLPYGSARNPWDTEHFAGTSSSGSAVAVASGMTRITIGSDTGGSIRSPACHCGVVGLKPTYGLVSRRGVFPLSFALDHVGPLGRSVGDAAAGLGVVAGYDSADPSSVDLPAVDYAAGLGAALERGLGGLRVGYARSMFSEVSGLSPEVLASVDAAAETLRGLGASVELVEVGDFDLFKACGRLIMLAEAFAVHQADLRSRPRDFGRYTYQRITAGATISAADLTEAMRVRRELTVGLNEGPLRRHDVLLTTTGLTPAARLDEFPRDWPPPGLTVAVQTAPFNVTGNPVLAVPCGFSGSGLPMGIQLVGRPFAEQLLLRVGAAFEAATGLLGRRPVLDEPHVSS